MNSPWLIYDGGPAGPPNLMQPTPTGQVIGVEYRNVGIQQPQPQVEPRYLYPTLEPERASLEHDPYVSYPIRAPRTKQMRNNWRKLVVITLLTICAFSLAMVATILRRWSKVYSLGVMVEVGLWETCKYTEVTGVTECSSTWSCIELTHAARAFSILSIVFLGLAAFLPFLILRGQLSPRKKMFILCVFASATAFTLICWVLWVGGNGCQDGSPVLSTSWYCALAAFLLTSFAMILAATLKPEKVMVRVKRYASEAAGHRVPSAFTLQQAHPSPPRYTMPSLPAQQAPTQLVQPPPTYAPTAHQGPTQAMGTVPTASLPAMGHQTGWREMNYEPAPGTTPYTVDPGTPVLPVPPPGAPAVPDPMAFNPATTNPAAAPNASAMEPATQWRPVTGDEDPYLSW
mmetsp:Transcript_8905/g.15879  ORF Transcript_8905/g.15879 Transcript_8905/m.15879 type:complete len:401 (-) Transcript_8905:45-1247(-)